MSADPMAPRRRAVTGGRRLVTALTVLALAASGCSSSGDEPATAGAAASADAAIEFREEVGPHVDDPDRAMAMTVDAIDIAGDDILMRMRVVNSDEAYLDMGVQDTIYGPLLVMRDDGDNTYESYAVEPAGVPGRRVADLSFRLVGPLDSAAETFTVELATQRGPLTSPAGILPDSDGVRWRIDSGSLAAQAVGDDRPGEPEPVFSPAPRLPDLVHFWLETDPLPVAD